MTDRRDYKLPESLAADLEAHKRDDQTFPAFVRETVLPALEGDDDTADAVDPNAIAGAVTDDLLAQLPRQVADELEGRR